MKRAAGVLLPIFSLPGKYGIGSFSREAYKFVDFLEEAGQSYWQILPLGPTSYGDSPYQSFSTFAGNPYFIDLTELQNQKLLTAAECDEASFGEDEEDIDYGTIYKNRFKVLRKAFKRAVLSEFGPYKDFLKENEDWLEDYAFYMAVKNSFNDVGLMEWKEDIRLRKKEAMDRYRRELSEDIDFYCFLQYEFYRQWGMLKSYANEKGIKIVGDIPIYVSLDSAEVWAHPELFQLDKNGRPTAVAGCPPDGFSADGQLWGNPLYDWAYHKKTGYAWWVKRMQKSKELYDVIRIDHFRGFDQYYSIPYPAENAKNGKWVDGPNIDLFKKLNQELGNVEIIAEDLGYITDTVRKLVNDTGYPNMKVLEFAFDPRDTGSANDYLPHNYGRNCVAYTGTHDNETVLGWLQGRPENEVKTVAEYLDGDPEDKEGLTRKMVRAVISSPANIAIIPLQDYLILDNSARINMPSTLGQNWRWRMNDREMSPDLAKEIFRLTRIYGRTSDRMLKRMAEEEEIRKAKAKKAEEAKTGKADTTAK